MTDREKSGLRGPVRIYRLDRTWFSQNCGAEACAREESGDSSIREFREDGTLLRHWHRNPDGSELTFNYESDERGRVSGKRVKHASGQEDVTYEYDGEGRLIRVVAGDRVTESYEYDADGRKKHIHHIVRFGEHPNSVVAYSVTDSGVGFSAANAATATTLFNERGKPTELLFHDDRGDLLSRVEFNYDQNGNLTEEVQRNSAQMLPEELRERLSLAELEAATSLLHEIADSTRYLYKYDEHGRRVESRSELGRLQAGRTTMSYNERGDLIGQTSENENREYSIGDDGNLTMEPEKQTVTRSETRMRYEYDGQGNWVEKTVEGRARADQEFTLCSVDRRAFEYFS